jgi:hypothetical protein
LTRTTFDESIMYTHVQTRLAQFDKQQERMRQALSLLLEDSGASSGHLLLFDQNGLFAAAAVNENQADDTLLSKAQAFLDAQLEVRTATVTASEVGNDQSSGAHLIAGNVALAPVPLIDRGSSPAQLVGVALLARRDAEFRAPRGELVRIVSRCLQEAGDSLAVALED